MKAHIMDLSPGDLLQHDVFNHFGVFVLQKGSELTNEAIAKLIQHGIDYVDIEPKTVQVDFPSSGRIANPVQRAKAYLDEGVDKFEEIFLEALTNGKFNESKVDEIMKPLLSELESQKDVVSLLLAIEDDDNYTYNHSMQVGMLCYYIAAWLGYSQEEAHQAGKAGYLLDIGKCKVPASILSKPGKLTPEEFKEVKLHTTYGHDIIMESTGDELSALVALQHHEREDGSGYPHGLRGPEIHPYAKIAAVADVYSAMTSNRVYGSKQELLSVLRELNSLSFGKLSPEPTQALIRHLLPNFIGKKVLLNSGESGSIVMTNHTDFFRPLVQTDTRFVDLSKEREISIAEVYL